jgi:hypothetical protein
MADAYMEYVHEDTNTVARWWGGEYIDLGFIDSEGEFHAWDVINVWDHAEDQPRIPRTLDALQAEVDEHMEDIR